MLYTREQLTNGIMDYIDREVIAKLPTSGKWLAGTMVALARSNSEEMARQLTENPVARALGITNEDGLIDVDRLGEALKESAGRYGNVQIQYPLIGRMSFSADDVDLLKRYIG